MEVLENLRFNRISRLLTREYKAGTKKTLERRLHNGFIFISYGKMIFTMNGKEYLGDKNTTILAPKGSHYDLDVIEDTFCFIFDFELDQGSFEELYSFPIFQVESFHRLFLEMQRESLIYVSNELMNLSRLYEVTAQINGYSYENSKFKMIDEAETYIEENIYNDKLCIKDAAKQSNISEVYFRRLFKEKHGISPLQYINEMRIKKAKRLLIESYDLSISEIARDCGYSDVYSFSRAFKNKIGRSPRSFKKNMQFRNC